MSKLPPEDAMLTFLRILPRKKPRDWKRRWKEAGEFVDWVGAEKSTMRAKASSPIWAALAGIWPDSTENEMPPFAFGSGMGWEDEKGNRYFDDKKDKEQEDEDTFETLYGDLLPTHIIVTLWL